ncbi:MAG: glycosyltransferase family 39 protein, partial [Candidatus Micrarchaeota archaeon]
MLKILDNKDVRLSVFLFLSLFLLYSYSAGFQLYSSDTYMNLAVAGHLLKKGTMNIAGLPIAEEFGYCQDQGFCVNPTPLGTMLSLWPFIVVEDFYSGNGPILSVQDIAHRFRFIDAIYGPFLIAATAAVLYLLLAELGVSRKNSFISVIIFALCTISWAYARTTFNVNLVTFLLTFSLFSLIRGFKRKNAAWLAAGSLSAGLMVLSRTDALFALPFLFLYAFFKLRESRSLKLAQALIIPVSVLMGVFLLFNQFAYGSLFNLGYSKHSDNFS